MSQLHFIYIYINTLILYIFIYIYIYLTIVLYVYSFFTFVLLSKLWIKFLNYVLFYDVPILHQGSCLLCVFCFYLSILYQLKFNIWIINLVSKSECRFSF